MRDTRSVVDRKMARKYVCVNESTLFASERVKVDLKVFQRKIAVCNDDSEKFANDKNKLFRFIYFFHLDCTYLLRSISSSSGENLRKILTKNVWILFVQNRPVVSSWCRMLTKCGCQDYLFDSKTLGADSENIFAIFRDASQNKLNTNFSIFISCHLFTCLSPSSVDPQNFSLAPFFFCCSVYAVSDRVTLFRFYHSISPSPPMKASSERKSDLTFSLHSLPEAVEKQQQHI